MEALLENFKRNNDVKVEENPDIDLVIIFQEQACDISTFVVHLYPKITKEFKLDKLFIGLCKKIDNPNYEELEKNVYSGLLIAVHLNEVYVFDLSQMPSRKVSDSNADPESTYGSRDGFVENYKDNIAVIRSRLKCNNLNLDQFSVGRRSKTDVILVSIDDIHNKEMKGKIINKINSIDVDAILSIDDFISYFCEKVTFPVFQYLGNPDLACRRLYLGEFLIIIDRIPVVLCMPTTIGLSTRFRVDETSMRIFPLIERLILCFSLFFSTMFLAVFASFVTFQSDCLSLLVLSILKVSQKTVMFPIAVEIFIVLALFELYHLIGYRQSKTTISGTVVLIGGLIIGQNMMESGIAGIFIVSFTALAFLTSFVVTSNAQTIFAISITRAILLIVSCLFGIFGFVCGISVLGYLAYKQQTFDVAYFHPFVPFDIKGFKEFFLPTANIFNTTRQKNLRVTDKTRRGNVEKNN